MAPDSRAEQRILDGSAWNDFCDRLKALGELVRRAETPHDVQNQALGYRYLTRLLRAGLEGSVDYADPQYPAFYRMADETKKVLNDNPDNFYQNCIIDPRFEYRISGTRGSVRWFSLGMKAGKGDAGGMASTGELDSTQMTFGDDGRFEIHVSREPQPGNWLPMTDDSRIIVVRQTFGDKQTEEIARLEIECLNPERPDNTLDPAAFETQLQLATGFVEATAGLGIDWMETYRHSTLNALPLHDQAVLQAAGGDPNISYYQSYWKLAPDEALLVHLTDIPDCEYWNLQISNYWMESLDHRFFRICVNNFNAHHEPDGSVRIVVAHEDPGAAYPNWLDTCRHDQGGMLGRYVGATDPPKEMPARVVKLGELRG